MQRDIDLVHLLVLRHAHAIRRIGDHDPVLLIDPQIPNILLLKNNILDYTGIAGIASARLDVFFVDIIAKNLQVARWQDGLFGRAPRLSPHIRPDYRPLLRSEASP